MRTALPTALLLGLVTTSVAQVPPAATLLSPPAEGWDDRLPQGQFQQPPPSTPPGYQQGYTQAQQHGYGAPVLILPPLRYGVPLCPHRAPPYFAGGFKPRGPYAAWHGSALPLNNDYGTSLGYGYGPQDPYARDPRDCAPAQSWNGDEGRVRQFYIPPGGRR